MSMRRGVNFNDAIAKLRGEAPKVKKPKKLGCSIEGCTKKWVTGGTRDPLLCPMHYHRKLRGSPLAEVAGEFVDLTPPSDLVFIGFRVPKLTSMALALRLKAERYSKPDTSQTDVLNEALSKFLSPEITALNAAPAKKKTP